MVEFAQTLSPESFEKLRSKAVDAILALQERADSQGTHHVGLIQELPEVSNQILRHVHSTLFRSAKPVTGAPKPYTHVTNGKVSVSSIFRDLMGNVDPKDLTGFVGTTNSTLRYHKLALRVPNTNSTYWLAPWPEGWQLLPVHAGTLTNKAKAEIDAQVRKFHKLQEAEFVTVKYDISQIPLPEPNPEAILDYLKKLIASYNKMRSTFEDQQKKYQEALRENLELKEKLEGSEPAEKWDTVIDELRSQVFLNGNSDSGK